MASGYTSMSSMERDTCKITVNGKSYTMAEYKKILKRRRKPKVRRPRSVRRPLKRLVLLQWRLRKC